MAQRHNDRIIDLIAGKFRALRKERKLTQEAVREDTGVNVKNIERGGMNLTITTITILCEYYEISLADFFRDIGAN